MGWRAAPQGSKDNNTSWLNTAGRQQGVEDPRGWYCGQYYLRIRISLLRRAKFGCRDRVTSCWKSAGSVAAWLKMIWGLWPCQAECELAEQTRAGQTTYLALLEREQPADGGKLPHLPAQCWWGCTSNAAPVLCPPLSASSKGVCRNWPWSVRRLLSLWVWWRGE